MYRYSRLPPIPLFNSYKQCEAISHTQNNAIKISGGADVKAEARSWRKIRGMSAIAAGEGMLKKEKHD